jgi:tyrosine-protein phosphatase SIW14
LRALGKETRVIPLYAQRLFGMVLVLLGITGPVALARWEARQMRNFHTVRDGVLYRSGQPALAGLKRAIHDRHIKTVVSLREAHKPGDPPPDLDEELFCKHEGLNYFRIPYREWYADEGPAPAEIGMRKFREIMADPGNYPVLVHCFAGRHRTGAYCAVYRMEFEHWTNAVALAEIKMFGYDTLDDEWDILGFLEEYRPSWREPLPASASAQRQRPPAKPGQKSIRRSRRHEEGPAE